MIRALGRTLAVIPAPTGGGTRPLGSLPQYSKGAPSGSNGQKRKDFNMAKWVQVFLSLKELINGNLL